MEFCWIDYLFILFMGIVIGHSAVYELRNEKEDEDDDE